MAGLSIYNVSDWVAGSNYNLYDIYKYNGFYYYAIVKHTAPSVFNTTYSNGVKSFNGVNKPYFFFQPGYSSSAQIRPAVREAKFGDGYSQRIPDGINNVLLSFRLIFDKRTDSEYRAIAHFLNARAGHESFVFTPPFPYNIDKLFVCPEWNPTMVFKDNNTLECQFVESVA